MTSIERGAGGVAGAVSVAQAPFIAAPVVSKSVARGKFLRQFLEKDRMQGFLRSRLED